MKLTTAHEELIGEIAGRELSFEEAAMVYPYLTAADKAALEPLSLEQTVECIYTTYFGYCTNTHSVTLTTNLNAEICNEVL